MAEGDESGSAGSSASSSPAASGNGRGRGGRRTSPPISDPRVDDGPANPPLGRNAKRSRDRTNPTPRPRDPLIGLGGVPSASPLPPSPSAAPPSSASSGPLGPSPTPSLPPPTGVSASPPSSGAQRGAAGSAPAGPGSDPSGEWPRVERATGELAATTAVADPDEVPLFETSPAARSADDDGLPADVSEDRSDGASRTSRARLRPSGRIPVIRPSAPHEVPSLPTHPGAGTDGQRDARGAADRAVTVRAADALGVDPLAAVAPRSPAASGAPMARQGAPVELPPAEMLATLVEPEPIVAPPPEPEPEPEPGPIPPTTVERITRALPIIFHRKPRRRVRRVTRVVRHIDTWSVFKVAVVFNAVLYVVCLTAGVLLWNVAYTTGTIDNVENFFEQFGWSSFEFHGGELYHHAWVAGLFAVVGLTGFAVLLATLFNLITDLVGGVRVSVLEEEVVARPTGGETTVIRRRPKREREERALAALERLERETLEQREREARVRSAAQGGNAGRFRRE